MRGAARPVGASAYSTPASLLLGAQGNQSQTAGAIAPARTSGKEAG